MNKIGKMSNNASVDSSTGTSSKEKQQKQQQPFMNRNISFRYWYSNTTCISCFIMILLAYSFHSNNHKNYDNNPSKTIIQSQLQVLQQKQYTIYWMIAQFVPIQSIQNSLQQLAWEYWDPTNQIENNNNEEYHIHPTTEELSLWIEQQIPVVNVQDHLVDDLLPYLNRIYGTDWRRRPLLLKNLWHKQQLNKEPNQQLEKEQQQQQQERYSRLSLLGLLNETLPVPYFRDARQVGLITPDAIGPLQEVVDRIRQGYPHKLGTQLLVATYPELIYEVAPTEIVTKLFGSYFTPDAVQGSGPFGLFPPLTTVPLFVANDQGTELPPSSSSSSSSSAKHQPQEEIDVAASEKEEQHHRKVFTGLHCEPIGNIAVQLSGKKQWTLIQPEYSYQLRPMLSPDGRAFYVSKLKDDQFTTTTTSTPHPNNKYGIPRYTAVTGAGDAMWVPTWTWHRVDYLVSKDVAIGASLFHFRFTDFVRNNPLFALLIIPALFQELVGYKTQ